MIAKFDEIEDDKTIGNKATSLVYLKKHGFQVPDGIVVDSRVYERIIEENNIFNQIQDILGQMTKENIKETSQSLIALFEDMKVKEDIQNAILEKLDNTKKYAVRSSGTKEDLEDYSFAGQYQSFLNIAKEDVIHHVIRCYQSMFSDTILSYAISHQIDVKEMAMSVIVQEMVDAEKSGICFTVNPISGNDKEMLIEVGKGIGENIVSGKVSPEQYRYNWYEEKWQYDSQNVLLNETLQAEMAKVFFEIQLLYGYPCDIEFAIKDEKLYILQARKITSIQYQGYQYMWSTADFKDGGVSSTICYPYMWSLYEYIWEYTLRKFFLDSKILNEKEVSPKLGEMFFARPYWNMSVVKLAMSKVVGYKEREFDSEFGVKSHYEGDGQTTKVSPKALVKIIRMAIAQKKILKTRNENAEILKKDLLNKYQAYKNDYDTKQVKDISKEWYRLTHDDYLYSESTYFWQIFINTIHQSLYKDSLLKYVSESEYLTLLGSIDNISHLLPFYEMWKISRNIRKDKRQLNNWKSLETSQIVSKLGADPSLKEVEQLVKTYGYHSDKELDVTYPCYYEDATPLVNSIKDMLELEDGFGPEKDRENGKKAYESILNPVREKTSKKKFQKIEDKIIRMRKMLWWREEFRDVSTRFYYLIRIYTIELAKKIVQDKVLQKEEDIWFLKVGHLWDYLDNKLTKEELQKIIEKNQKYYYAYLNYMSENEIGPVGSAQQTKVEGQLKGLGANSGRVTGRARVIESFEEIDRLQENDILVTKFTDTGWTPKFAILSGIVTEYGGILCHAAIVSREYGIPAIVNCHDAMSTIKDGQRITIDGATGIVMIEK